MSAVFQFSIMFRNIFPIHRPGLECVKKENKTALFFVPLVPGFSTASYLKVHIKTHHGSPLPTIHTFPEPRGELQMHNGNPFHMGRQCLVEGKQSLVLFQTFTFLAFLFALLLFGDGKNKAHTASSLFEKEHNGFCCYMFAFTCSDIMLDVGIFLSRIDCVYKSSYDYRVKRTALFITLLGIG